MGYVSYAPSRVHRLLPPLAIAAVLFSFTVERRASAFCRTTTNQSFVPTATQPCDTTGTPIAWASKCVGYSLQKDASVQVTLTQATNIAHASFGEWSAHDCQPCSASGKPTILGEDLGTVVCSNVEYVQGGGNANAIVFRDSTWPHDAVALALTTVTFKLDTGEIFDADMEIQSNPKDVTLSVTDPVPAGGFDLRSIMTHEAGHFFGLAHTQPENRDATMFATYQPGETLKRDLAQDDICGICTIYPPTRTANCDPTPRGGLSDNCDIATSAAKGGCTCNLPGGAGSGVGSAGLALASLLGLTGWLRRARRP
jgi:hypothetical protein